jgi:type VI secretion system protein VasG
MAAIGLKSLIGRLNGICRRTIEEAAGRTMSRSHYNLEIEHWLHALCVHPECDMNLILRHYQVDHLRLVTDLDRALDKLKTGNSGAPSLSPEVVELVKQAWLVASIEQNAISIRSGHLLWALLADETLARRAHDTSRQLLRVDPDLLKRDLLEITKHSAEEQDDSATDRTPVSGNGARIAIRGTPVLEEFTIDLTTRAKAGKIDPVFGRDIEIRQIIDILMRRRQNNPILTGEAGVGKTALVEGLALRLASGDVPPKLQGVSLRTLDLGLLQAGTGIAGELESRLRGVIDEISFAQKPIILFIDEAHQLIGAGGQRVQFDAANLLKPALARGELRTIAATTWAEYKKYFEKDAALTLIPLSQVGLDMVCLSA